MVSTSFYVWWFVFLVALLLLAGWIGKRTKAGAGYLGILVDQRVRYSLTHFQIVLWTIVILSSLLAVLVSQRLDPRNVEIPPELLGLMGISAGSAVLATAVKAGKDAGDQFGSIARGIDTLTASHVTIKGTKPHFAQMWLEEEGDQAEKVVNITKYQNFILTIVILCVYVTLAWESGKLGKLPVLPEKVVWLIGISHAGYVGGKIPNQKKTEAKG